MITVDGWCADLPELWRICNRAVTGRSVHRGPRH